MYSNSTMIATKPYSIKPDDNNRHSVRHNSQRLHTVEIHKYTNTACLCGLPHGSNENKLLTANIQDTQPQLDTWLVHSVCWISICKNERSCGFLPRRPPHFQTLLVSSCISKTPGKIIVEAQHNIVPWKWNLCRRARFPARCRCQLAWIGITNRDNLRSASSAPRVGRLELSTAFQTYSIQSNKR